MKVTVVTDQSQKWFEITDGAVVTARHYLAEPDGGNEAGMRLLNLCRTGRYQGRGYYVSLLAEARGQRPFPDVKTIEDLRSEAFVRTLGDEMRVTVVATGLSRPKSNLTVVPTYEPAMATGTHGYVPNIGGVGVNMVDPASIPTYQRVGKPDVWSSHPNRVNASAKVNALSSGGMDDFEIPAFLRRQAD